MDNNDENFAFVAYLVFILFVGAMISLGIVFADCSIR